MESSPKTPVFWCDDLCDDTEYVWYNLRSKVTDGTQTNHSTTSVFDQDHLHQTPRLLVLGLLDAVDLGAIFGAASNVRSVLSTARPDEPVGEFIFLIYDTTVTVFIPVVPYIALIVGFFLACFHSEARTRRIQPP